MRVLIVDSDGEEAAVTASALRFPGQMLIFDHRCKGEEALHTLANKPIDLMVVDLTIFPT